MEKRVIKGRKVSLRNLGFVCKSLGKPDAKCHGAYEEVCPLCHKPGQLEHHGKWCMSCQTDKEYTAK